MATTNFLTKNERKELKSNIDLSSLSKSDIEFLYDLYITKYPAYKHFKAKLIADIISKDLNINITERDINIIRDISLQEDVLDKKLMMSNLGLYDNIEEYDY